MFPARSFKLFLNHIKANPNKYPRIKCELFIKHLLILRRLMKKHNKTLYDYGGLREHNIVLCKIIITKSFIDSDFKIGDQLEVLFWDYIQSIIYFAIEKITPL